MCCRVIALPVRVMSDQPDPQTLARLEAAVRALPDAEREIFLAVRLDDLSYAKIARRTGYSAERVERLFAKAFVQIARAMNEGGES